jgi:N-carbamoyl-L-amino-acid hydrolase
MINSQRLLKHLNELREFGRCGNGVVRPCLTEVDMQSREWLVNKMRDAGLDAQIDGIANVIGRSTQPGKAILIGSHTDTQRTGGWLDGALGVIYGLEIAQSFAEQQQFKHLSIDVASWADEEAHYLSLMGSRSFCGVLTSQEIERAKNREGHPLRQALQDCGLDQQPRLQLDIDRYRGYLEAHIEQGPWLEQEHKKIGVVTSIVGMQDLTITFNGQQNHAGTTPMHLRQDAAKALFNFSQAIDQLFADIRGPYTVWTIGQIELTPNSRSIIPGYARANLQFRDPDQALVERLQSRTFELVASLTSNELEIEVIVHDDSARAINMDTAIQAALASAAQQLAPEQWRQMPSGAAHDAQVLAAHLPSGMIFIPSIGGISHDFAEDSTDSDIVLGCNVLAQAIIKLLQ